MFFLYLISLYLILWAFPYPVSEQVNALCKFRKVTEAIGVTGSIFNDKEIYAILIEELNFNPVQGNSSVMPFTIRAISDTLENLRL